MCKTIFILFFPFEQSDQLSCSTEIEQAKWVNTSRGVLGVLSLVSLVIIGMELTPKPPKPVPAPTPTVVIEREKPDLRDFEDED